MPTLNEVHTGQLAASRKVEDALNQVSAEIQKLDRENLKSEALAKLERDIRQRAFGALAPTVGKALQDNSEWARKEVRIYTDEAVRRRARFHSEDEAKDAMMRMDFRQIVASYSTAELVEYLKDVPALYGGEKALARAELIRLEWGKRPPGETLPLREAFAQAMSSVPAPSHDEERRKLNEIVQKGKEGELKLASLIRGRDSSPEERMTAHRVRAL